MDLEERIARLINPDAWETVDRGGVVGLPSARVFVLDSLKTARRVIDGLHLQQDIFRTYAGNPVHHLIRGHTDDQEDMSEPATRVRQIYEEDM